MSKLIFREKLEKYFKIPDFLPTMLCIKIYTDSQIKNLRSSCGHGTKAVIQNHKSINE